MTLYEQIRKTIEERTQAEALIFEHRHYSYLELGEKIIHTAGKLTSIGVKKRDVVTVLLPNCPESVFIFYGLSCLGAISYNVHPLTPASTVMRMVEAAHSKIVICLRSSATEIRKALPADVMVIAVNPYSKVNFLKSLAFSISCKLKGQIIDYSKTKATKSFDVYEEEGEREDAVYMNTGGTTGEMKVVRLSNESINWIAKNSIELIGTEAEKAKILAALPFFHVFGLGMGLHAPLTLGASACLMLKFNTKEAIKQLKKKNITIIIGVPALFKALLAKKEFYGPHLKHQIAAYVGGDYCSDELVDEWDEVMSKHGSSSRLYVGYGLTETSTACNVNSPCGKNKKGSVGKTIAGVKNMIIDLKTGKACSPGVLGEIVIGGPSLMNGYLGDESLTAETMFVDDRGERWLHTKDFGYIDEEGYLFFKQRTRRVAKINGETLCPSDVENVVNSLPGIYESYCYGKEDERKGQVFRLLIVIRRMESAWSKDEAKEKVISAIASSLPPAYMPEEIVFLEKMPRTAVGKIDQLQAEQL